MSIHRLSALDAFCDNCHRSFGAADDEPSTAVGNHWGNMGMPQARADMKTYGWKTSRNGGRLMDLCPKCVEEQTQGTSMSARVRAEGGA